MAPPSTPTLSDTAVPGRLSRKEGLTMPQLRTKQGLAAALTVVAIVLAAGLYALAQQPYQLAPMDESKRDRGVSVSGAGGKFYVLPATLDTTQWGWLDPKEPPKLVVNSGDTVAIETMMHAHNAIQPGTTMDDIVKLRLANPGGGPHSMTGPVYVEGAEPGDTLEIRIKKIVPKAFATNFHLPGAQFPTVGQLAPEFPQGFIRYYYLDWEKKQAEFKPGIMIALQPGQRRGEPHRARVLVPRVRHPAARAQGHEARLAADRDADALDRHRLRRGPQRGDEDRHARDGEHAGGPEDGAAEP